MTDSGKQPISQLGDALKSLRVKHSKTEAELSGAVEIDQERLKDFEAGKMRPSEDVLLLIIQHFNLKDTMAQELWQLAGYSGQPSITDYFEHSESQDIDQPTKTVMVSQHDARIVYTDMVQIMVNNFGVIINFLQGAGPNNQPLAVSRVGMSREHADSLLELLKKTLEQADEANKNPESPKQLSAGSTTDIEE